MLKPANFTGGVFPARGVLPHPTLTFLLQPICHLPERFGDDRLSGFRNIASKKANNKDGSVRRNIGCFADYAPGQGKTRRQGAGYNAQDRVYGSWRQNDVKFTFVKCGGLSRLHVSFLLHVKYTLSYIVSYRIVSYRKCDASQRERTDGWTDWPAWR